MTKTIAVNRIATEHQTWQQFDDEARVCCVRETTLKREAKCKRMNCALDLNYLLKVFAVPIKTGA
ncbi:MAG TPA: hypothetical protein DD473_16125 [Planctomycetaceae bacterium]|nr:hypothetical protein [Planctomycetaceae bacterium]